MLLVTGAAGFIGSNVVAGLNEAGRTDVAVNDIIGAEGKWRNLAKRQVADVVPPAELFRWLDGRKLDAVIHMGAISDTTATDADLVLENNFRLSLKLLDWCTETRTPFIYASSAATYGDGAAGFDDDWSLEALKKLKPMNLYGWSKHLFDLAIVERAVKKEKLPPQWCGLSSPTKLLMTGQTISIDGGSWMLYPLAQERSTKGRRCRRKPLRISSA